MISGVFGCALIAGGCVRSTPDTSADFESFKEVFAAYNAASEAAVAAAKALPDASRNERNAKSLQVHYAMLTPALDEFVTRTHDIDPALEADVLRWHKLVSELNKLLSQIVDSEDYNGLDDERSRVNQLLVSEEAVSGRIAQHFSEYSGLLR
ncbi:hypothetical protein [Roseiconus lacunae]|nr:hypothetical protein [Roseiconus lacunae]